MATSLSCAEEGACAAGRAVVKDDEDDGAGGGGERRGDAARARALPAAAADAPAVSARAAARMSAPLVNFEGDDGAVRAGGDAPLPKTDGAPKPSDALMDDPDVDAPDEGGPAEDALLCALRAACAAAAAGVADRPRAEGASGTVRGPVAIPERPNWGGPLAAPADEPLGGFDAARGGGADGVVLGVLLLVALLLTAAAAATRGGSPLLDAAANARRTDSSSPAFRLASVAAARAARRSYTVPPLGDECVGAAVVGAPPPPLLLPVRSLDTSMGDTTGGGEERDVMPRIPARFVGAFGDETCAWGAALAVGLLRVTGSGAAGGAVGDFAGAAADDAPLEPANSVSNSVAGWDRGVK